MVVATAIPYSPPTLVRRAERCDLDELSRLEHDAWPDGDCMRADADEFAHRIAVGGVLVAQRRGRIVGSLTTFRPRWAHARVLDEIVAHCPAELLSLPTHERWSAVCERWGLPIDWHAATADGHVRERGMHRPGGDVIFGVGIATDPTERSTNIASALLEHALVAARRSGVRYFVGYGRLPQFHASTLSLDAYLRRTRVAVGAEVPHDVTLRLHWRAGARPARTRDGDAMWLGIPAAMRDDPESRGAGVLVVTPLGRRSPFPLARAAASIVTSPR